jgi:hypothetical protein
VAVIDHTAAFIAEGEGLQLLRLYPDGAGNITEADLDRWTGGANTQNLITFTPTVPECVFVSGALARNQNTAWVLFGEACQPGGNRWRLVRVALENGTGTEVASGPAGGSFFADTFTAQVFPATDGSAALVAAPSGLDRHNVTLFWVMPDGTTRPVAEFALADRLGDANVEARHLRRSPDGQWIAAVLVTRAGQPSVRLIDLASPGSPGQDVLEAGAHDQIIDLRWGPGGRLVVIAGSATSNTLFVIAPGAEPTRIARGRFTSLEPDEGGQWIGVTGWVPNPEDSSTAISQAALIDLNGTILPLRQGRSGDEAFEILGVLP